VHGVASSAAILIQETRDAHTDSTTVLWTERVGRYIVAVTSHDTVSVVSRTGRVLRRVEVPPDAALPEVRMERWYETEVRAVRTAERAVATPSATRPPAEVVRADRMGLLPRQALRLGPLRVNLSADARHEHNQPREGGS
jgi:hypothetical protein